MNKVQLAALLAKARASREMQERALNTVAATEVANPAEIVIKLPADFKQADATPEFEVAATVVWEEAVQKAPESVAEVKQVTTSANARVADLLAKARARVAAKAAANTSVADIGMYQSPAISSSEETEVANNINESVTYEHSVDADGNRFWTTVTGKEVTLNKAQEEFVTAICAGESVVMIGKAGTGKTTTAGIGMTELIRTGKLLPMSNGTDNLRAGLPGVAVVSFTNKAVNNIRKQMPMDLQPHCLTIHKLLEFKPKYYEVTDPDTGVAHNTMRFEPTRTVFNPLPCDLRMVVIEESSMVDIALHQMLVAALPVGCIIVYLGDIRQLPPVFGSAILGFKMLELRVIELTEVYRQALLSPILRAAIDIDDGKDNLFNSKVKVKDTATGKWIWPVLYKHNESGEHGSLRIQCWQKELSPDLALLTAIKFMNTLSDAGKNHYNPDSDIILCPFNKSFGTVELNKGISQHLGRKRGAVVHEVIAGFEKHYLAVGDRVLYAKDDAFIIAIAMNTDYMGKRAQAASTKLNRWGHYEESMTSEELALQEELQADADLAAIEFFLESAANTVENRVTAASHIITLKVPGVGEDDWSEVELETASDINNLLGGYAITVHKSQGSEYQKVFILLHKSHQTMNSRELLYTAWTRAKQDLFVLCEPDTIEKGICSQRIKGNTLAEKAEFFKGKMDQYTALIANDPAELERIADIKDKCSAALLKAVEALNAQYPNRQPLEIKEVTYIDNGSASGTAKLSEGIINLNPLYIKWDFKEIIKETIPHEVAHIAAAIWFQDFGHGTAWKQLCKEAGGNGSIYHESGSAKSLRGRKK